MLSKKNLSLILALLFFISGVEAQTPQDRTTSTIIADALAQLPAEKQNVYNQTMESLVVTGEDGLNALINMMDASGKKSNETVEYAISGWTNFVANKPADRTIAVAAYTKALQQPLDIRIKQFLIRQLELIGDDTNVEILASFLNNIQLASPAAQALANINSQSAVLALIESLKNTEDEQLSIVLVNAVGQTENVSAENVLLNILAESPSEELCNLTCMALSKVGTMHSVQPLKSLAAQSGFSIHTNKATTAYIDLLFKLIPSHPVEIRKEAQQLQKLTAKSNQNNVRIASTEILMQLPDINKDKLLKTALKDQNPAYVSHVLNFYSGYTTQTGIDLVIKATKKTKSDLMRTSLLYWLGQTRTEKAAPVIIQYLHDQHADVQKAAVRSLANLDPELSLHPLIGLLTHTDAAVLENAYQTLAAFDSDVSTALISNYPDFSNEGKAVALKLLGLRKASSSYHLVYTEMMSAADTKVQQQAAVTLKDVISADKLTQLFDLVEQENSNYAADIQTAVNQALSFESVEKQLEIITGRMSKANKAYLYYPSLANTGSTSALAIIMDGYNQSGSNAQAAFNALLSMKTFDAVYPLLDIARAGKDKAEISKAVDALINLIVSSTHTGIVKANYLQEVMLLAQTGNQKKTILNQLANTDSFQALLFTERFLNDKALREVAAQAGMKIALNNPQYAGGVTTKILTQIEQVLDNPDAEYQRQAIQKYFNDNKETNGFVSIFNGKDLTGWRGLVGTPITRAAMPKKKLEEAQIKADQAAAESWVVEEDGVLLFTGKGNNLCTEKQYDDFEMWVDWKLLPGKEPDAGIYLRGTPQVQIWDTARVQVGAQVGSGGLYNNRFNESKPIKVADQKVGEWNTFYIKMVGDRVTVYLNGALVTDNIILENYWDRTQPIFPTEQIELQAHGSKVMYRNIFIKEIPRPEPFQLSKQEEKEGFKILFDGGNMYQWTGNTTDYITEDGCMVIYPSRSFGGNLYTKEEFDDFIFRFQFQLTPGANNGLGIRTPMEGDAAYVGMELQILDNGAPIYKNLNDYQYHGSVYGIIPAKRGALKPVGEWNYQEVIAKGDHIKITLNGHVIVDGNIRDAVKNGTPDGKEHPGLFNKKGHIGFLGHGSIVKFKEIRIKRL